MRRSALYAPSTALMVLVAAAGVQAQGRAASEPHETGTPQGSTAGHGSTKGGEPDSVQALPQQWDRTAHEGRPVEHEPEGVKGRSVAVVEGLVTDLEDDEIEVQTTDGRELSFKLDRSVHIHKSGTGEGTLEAGVADLHEGAEVRATFDTADQTHGLVMLELGQELIRPEEHGAPPKQPGGKDAPDYDDGAAKEQEQR